MKWPKSGARTDVDVTGLRERPGAPAALPQATVPDPLVARRRFASRLVGEGIEIGPGHSPFPVPAGVKVSYVDRWEPTENSSLFPELGDPQTFPKPDIPVNLDRDRLSAVPDESQDFVIASHIIEHLANPLAMLMEIHRVLRPGGFLILLLPDRHRTFDRERAPTPLAHLVDEYRRDIREVDDAHIVDFIIGCLKSTGDDRDTNLLVFEPSSEEIDLHRRRSVHAHVWDMSEFEDVLAFAAAELKVCFDVVDAVRPGDEGTHGNEFGWLLERRA
jgi:SAM-dependent methyltransferase